MKFDGTADQLEMIREIAEGMTDPVFLVDKAFNVWYHNRAFETLVGIRMSSRRYKGAPCHKLLGLEICESMCVMRQTVESLQNVRLAEIGGTTADGELHNFHINAVPVTNSNGAPLGALVFLRDITAETQIHKKYKDLVARNTAVSLSGRIEQGNLMDIIQLVSFLQKTGRLALSSSHGEGEIWFEAGQMVSIGLGVTSGEKAFGRLLNWEQGAFTFQPESEVQVENRLTKPSDFVLMDAVREKDELAAKEAHLPAGDVRPNVLRIVSAEEDGISEVEWGIYELGVQGHSVAEIVETLAFPDARILMAFLGCKEKGILSW